MGIAGDLIRNLVRAMFSDDTTDWLILRALVLTDMSALEMMDEAGIGLGRIYVALNRLEHCSLIGSYWVEPSPTRLFPGRRKFYYLRRANRVMVYKVMWGKIRPELIHNQPDEINVWLAAGWVLDSEAAWELAAT